MSDVAAVLPESRGQGVQFEESHVRHVYDEIASRVNDIQHKAWPYVKRFLKKFDAGSIVADIGCGNGRYLHINKGIYKVGIDVCKAMVDNSRLKGYEVCYADNLRVPYRDGMFDGVISIGVVYHFCSSERYEVCYADNLRVPYRDGMFDGVISIGVVHHFCSSERRIQALQELARILQPGGRLMLYVWAYEQKHRKFDSQDVLIPWHEHKKHRFRTGSAASSRHSSLGGISSASSMSEDDSLLDQQGNQSTDTRAEYQSNSPRVARRQSSSLDDLSSVLEMNFKPSYYALDFNTSPYHRRTASVVGGGGPVDDLASIVKGNVVSECQKLEASLRAMSVGSLDEVRQLDDVFAVAETDSMNGVEEYNGLRKMAENGDRNGYHDTEKVSRNGDNFGSSYRTTTEHLTNGTSKLSAASVKNGHSFKEELLERKNSEKGCKFYLGKSDECETKGKTKIVPKCSKINPFMKKDSCDSYSFNNVSGSLPSANEADSFQELDELVNDTDSLDEVFVNFKPHKQEEKQPSKSLITSLKSKFLKIFNDDTENEKSKATTNPSLRMKNGSKSENNINTMTAGKAQLTPEQQSIANKLGFKVREFPQSSCPELSEKNHTTEAKTDTHDQSYYAQVRAGYIIQDSIIDETAKSKRKLSKDRKPSGFRSFESALSFEKKKDNCVCMKQASQESEALSDIYDGYINIEKLVNSPKQSPKCASAFNVARDAKTNGSRSYSLDSNCDKSDNRTESCSRSRGCRDRNMCNGCDAEDDLKTYLVTNGNRCNRDNENRQINLNGGGSGNWGKSENDDTLSIDSSKDYPLQGGDWGKPAIDRSVSMDSAKEYPHKGGDFGKSAIGRTLSNDSTRDFYPHKKDMKQLDDLQSTQQQALSQDDDDGAIDSDFSSKLCRYYHVFREGELESLIASHVKSLRIVQCCYDHANWCIIAEKI